MRNKKELYKLCKEQLEHSIEEIEAAIADRREAISNETKSSMGDKYETTREMLQQDINMNLDRLRKAKLDLDILNTIDNNTASDCVSMGSWVETNNATFYIAVSFGKLKIDDQIVYVISPSSPIGKQLIGKNMNDIFILNSNKYVIKKII